MYCPGSKFDHITPVDMGSVGGKILASGQQKDGEKTVVLFGPEMTAQGEALKIIASKLGKDVSIKSITAQEQIDIYKMIGLPPPLAEYLAKGTGENDKENFAQKDPDRYNLGVANIQKYLGRPATSFEAWVDSNKQLFSA